MINQVNSKHYRLVQDQAESINIKLEGEKIHIYQDPIASGLGEFPTDVFMDIDLIDSLIDILSSLRAEFLK